MRFFAHGRSKPAFASQYYAELPDLSFITGPHAKLPVF